MNRLLLAIAATAAGLSASAAVAGPPPYGYPGAAFRPVYPVYPAYRPVYPGWGAGYWGPRAGVYVGGPGYWGAWPYAAAAWPYAYAPVVVAAAPAPQVYVQQEPAPLAAQPATSFWYYCAQPAGYFPYVQECNQAWMKVVPQVPGAAVTTPPRLAP